MKQGIKYELTLKLNVELFDDNMYLTEIYRQMLKKYAEDMTVDDTMEGWKKIIVPDNKALCFIEWEARRKG